MCTQAPFPSVSSRDVWAFLPIGSNVYLPLTSVCKCQCYFRILASWFWCVSDVEDHLWTLTAIWALLPIGSEWCLSAIEDHLWEWGASWAFLPIGFDVCLPLSTVCEHWVSFGYFANWLWHQATIEDHLCWASVHLGLHTSNPQRGFMTDLSFGVWVCIPLVWNEHWPFPVLWPLLIFPNFLAYWEPHEQNEKVHIHNGILLSPEKGIRLTQF